MIALAEPLSAGGAVRVVLAPPAAAGQWRILRSTTGVPSGPSDPDAVVAADWGRYEALIDHEAVVDGIAYTYRVFYRDAAGAALASDSDTRTVTPSYAETDVSVSALRILRDRLAYGLRQAVASGRLQPATGRIPLVTAPAVNPDQVTLPIVSVHLASDRPADRGVSDLVDMDMQGIGTDVGWMSEITINVVGVSANPDERITLGEVLKHIIISSLPIFSVEGMLRCAFSLSHTEWSPDNTKAQPLYVAAGSFTCVAPSGTATTRASIIDTVITQGVFY